VPSAAGSVVDSSETTSDIAGRHRRRQTRASLSSDGRDAKIRLLSTKDPREGISRLREGGLEEGSSAAEKSADIASSVIASAVDFSQQERSGKGKGEREREKERERERDEYEITQDLGSSDDHHGRIAFHFRF